jgi:hypothetical protein
MEKAARPGRSAKNSYPLPHEMALSSSTVMNRRYHVPEIGSKQSVFLKISEQAQRVKNSNHLHCIYYFTYI